MITTCGGKCRKKNEKKSVDLAKKCRNRNIESWLGGGDHLSVNHLPRSTLSRRMPLNFRFIFFCASVETSKRPAPGENLELCRKKPNDTVKYQNSPLERTRNSGKVV